MLPGPREAALTLVAALLLVGLAAATSPEGATEEPCEDESTLETRPAHCSHVQWHLVRFQLQQNETIRLDAKLIAESAAHWGFYWSRWSSDERFRISTDHGTPRTAHTSLGVAGQNHSIGMDAPQADMGITNGLRYRETEFVFQEKANTTDHVWLLGAGSDRPLQLEIEFALQPENLTVQNGTRGHFRHLSGFDDGVVVQAGGIRPPGATLGSIALAAAASQDIHLAGQTHGTFGLTGHELDYQVENDHLHRANGTLQSGRIDVQLFDLQPGPWAFTVNRLVGAATPESLTTPGSGILLLLETPQTIDYPDDKKDLVIPQVHPHETLINP